MISMMGEAGPTQGAERHKAVLQEGWTARPRLARALRIAIFVIPIVLSFAFSIAAGRVAPADELGINRWLWIAAVFLMANVLLLLLRRLTSKLIPLVALMKLTLVFPDNAPSRTKAALRTSNSKSMLRSMRTAQANGETTGEATNGDYLVQLLREINDHDRLTRGHSERVRAYSELIGKEIGLDEDDLNKLRWAALLHDVGKLSVPHEILNKDGRPTDEEWTVLSGHPSAGMPLLEPLRDWLGDWVHAADQHHCRWDGGGYPTKLAGTDITLAGRIVAIADAYDVMTSARSYKKPLAAEVARQELTDCAGKQFDPSLVRAFLQIGLGRIQSVAGPLAWLSNLTGSAQLPVPAANAVSSGAWSVGVAATGAVTVGVSSVFAPAPPPQAIALDVPAVVAEDATVTATAGRSFDVVLRAAGEDLTFLVGDAVHGEVVLARFPEPVPGDDAGALPPNWEAIASYTPSATHIGEDGFSFEVCDPALRCDQGSVTLQFLAPPQPPTTEPPPTTTSTTETPAVLETEPPTTAVSPAPTITASPPTTTEPTTTTTEPTTTTTEPPNGAPTAVDDDLTIDEDDTALVDVMANDTDPEGDALTLTGVGGPLRGTAAIVGDQVRYTPDPDANGVDQFSYTVSDGENPDVVGVITVTITPVNDAPIVVAPDTSIGENAPVGTVLFTTGVTDPDGDSYSYRILGDSDGRFSIDSDGVFRLAAPLDHEALPIYNLNVRVFDGVVYVRESVVITVVDIDEAPLAVDDVAAVSEDTTASFTIGGNDADPEGAALTWSVPVLSDQGGSLSETAGTVTYTPAADFDGTDTFIYTVNDPAGNTSDPATVTVTVAASNDAPTVADDAGLGFGTSEDLAFVTGNVLANDSDVDDPINTATITVISDASFGTLTNNDNGTFGYDPDPDFAGTDAFQYRLTDQNGQPSTAATVTIVVSALNDPPVASNDTLTVSRGSAGVTVDVRSNDTDVDGDALTVAAWSDGGSGTVASNGDGTLTYTHDDSATTSDSFSYTVRDPSGLTNSATVVVTIVAQTDGDGVPGGDNCPDDYNPTQLDTDSDGIGDVCDPTPTSASSATFGGSGIPSGNAGDHTMAVAIADFDGDGRTDAAFANDGQANQVFRNVAGLLFNTGQDLGSENSRGIAAGDLDGDGSFDLVFANSGSPNTVYLNDGSGAFILSAQTTDNADSWAVAVGDFDGDGDLDAVFANDGEANRVWFNDGAGALTASAQALGSGSSKGVAVADLNGDQHLDLVFSNDGQADEVWFNNGSGLFVDSGQTLSSGRSHATAIGDLDGDGDLDMVIAGDNDGDSVWLNNGTGVFTQTGQTLGLGHSRAVAVGDLDGDGDLDVAFGDHSGPNSVWLNNGVGQFTDSGQLIDSGGGDKTEGIALADLDGDGDLGLVSANDQSKNRVHGNS